MHKTLRAGDGCELFIFNKGRRKKTIGDPGSQSEINAEVSTMLLTVEELQG